MSVPVPNQTVAITRNDLPTPDFRRWQLAITDAVNTTVPVPPPEPVTGDYLPLSTYLIGDGNILTFGSLASGGVNLALAALADSGTGALLGITRDAQGRVSGTTDATITGTAGEIDVADGDAVAGPPTLSLSDTGVTPGSYTNADLTVDAKGRITAVANGAGGGGTDLKTTARFYDEGYLPAATMGWVVDASGTGAVLAQQSVAGMNGAYGLASGGTATNRGGMLHGGFFCEVGGGEIRAYARLEPQLTPSGSQQSQYGFGLKSGVGTTGVGDFIHVLADDATGGWLLQWTCLATGTSGVSAIPGTIVGGAIQELEIVVAGGGGSVSFSIDGIVVDTLALPVGFVALRPYLRSRKNGASGGSSTLWVDKVLVEQDR